MKITKYFGPSNVNETSYLLNWIINLKFMISGRRNFREKYWLDVRMEFPSGPSTAKVSWAYKNDGTPEYYIFHTFALTWVDHLFTGSGSSNTLWEWQKEKPTAFALLKLEKVVSSRKKFCTHSSSLMFYLLSLARD